jgi:hypothetical protein
VANPCQRSADPRTGRARRLQTLRLPEELLDEHPLPSFRRSVTAAGKARVATVSTMRVFGGNRRGRNLWIDDDEVLSGPQRLVDRLYCGPSDTQDGFPGREDPGVEAEEPDLRGTLLLCGWIVAGPIRRVPGKRGGPGRQELILAPKSSTAPRNRPRALRQAGAGAASGSLRWDRPTGASTAIGRYARTHRAGEPIPRPMATRLWRPRSNPGRSKVRTPGWNRTTARCDKSRPVDGRFQDDDSRAG